MVQLSLSELHVHVPYVRVNIKLTFCESEVLQ